MECASIEATACTPVFKHEFQYVAAPYIKSLTLFMQFLLKVVSAANFNGIHWFLLVLH